MYKINNTQQEASLHGLAASAKHMSLQYQWLQKVTITAHICPSNIPFSLFVVKYYPVHFSKMTGALVA